MHVCMCDLYEPYIANTRNFDGMDMKPVRATEPGLTQGRRDAGQLQNKSPPGESHPLSFSLCAAVYISACVRHLIGMKVGQTNTGKH